MDIRCPDGSTSTNKYVQEVCKVFDYLNRKDDFLYFIYTLDLHLNSSSMDSGMFKPYACIIAFDMYTDVSEGA